MRKVIRDAITVYTFSELLALEKAKQDHGACEKAREWLREGATNHDWWDYLYEMFTTSLDQIGFENADIQFSGFWSQGDGASFTASVDMPKLIDFLSDVETEPNNCINVGEDGQELFIPWLMFKLDIPKGHGNPKYRHLLKLHESGDIQDVTVERISSHYSHENTCDFKGSLNDRGDGHFEGDRWIWESKQPRVHALFESFLAEGESLRYDICKMMYRMLEEEYEYLTSDESFLEYADEYEFEEDGSFHGHVCESEEHQALVLKKKRERFLGEFDRHPRKVGKLRKRNGRRRS